MSRKFKFRCNPVLPEVYDDALSYYEVLGKLTQAINEIGEEIDEGLIDFIREALPELISDIVYDPDTDTLEFTLVDDASEDVLLSDPISRISLNGISRPVVDTEARTMLNSSWLKNKSICLYGDSTLTVTETYATYLINAGICSNVTVRGSAGKALTTSGLTEITNASDLNTFDYVFVCYGINDWAGVVKYRWLDAVRSTITTIINSGSEPVFVLPWFVYIPTFATTGFINNWGADMAAFVDGAIDICQEMSVKYFNLYELAGVNQYNFETMLTPSANGYYLHEGVKLGQYIAKAILNGNYNTGPCKTGNLCDAPFKTFLPTNFAYPQWDGMKVLSSNIYPRFRRGKTTGITSSARCVFAPVQAAGVCRMTGFVTIGNTGYITIGYISVSDPQQTFVPLTRVNNNSDFDFTFTIPDTAANWKPAIDVSTAYGIIYDFTLYSELGEAKLVNPDSPTDPALKINYGSDVDTVLYPGYIKNNGDQITLTSHNITLKTDHAAGTDVTIGQLPFYTMYTIYGNCRIGANEEHFRILPDGSITIHGLTANYTAPARILFNQCDVTPLQFYVHV